MKKRIKIITSDNWSGAEDRLNVFLDTFPTDSETSRKLFGIDFEQTSVFDPIQETVITIYTFVISYSDK